MVDARARASHGGPGCAGPNRVRRGPRRPRAGLQTALARAPRRLRHAPPRGAAAGRHRGDRRRTPRHRQIAPSSLDSKPARRAEKRGGGRNRGGQNGMNIPRDPDTVLAAWLEDGPLELPRETRHAIAVGIRTVPRRRPGVGWPFGDARLGEPNVGLRRLSVALGSAAVVVVAAALALDFYADQPAVGGPVPTA